LIERINTLKTKYNKQGLFYIYENAELSRKEINKDLINKGGIYIWWCGITGLFYIGSAKSFVGKNGRLNEYFQKSRLELISKTKISSNLAEDMLKYPKNCWNLIILEASENLSFEVLRNIEQFWMLLVPTYNRSFVIGSNEGLPISEERREALSTLFYIYEISKEGLLIPNSEHKIFGIKNLARTGIVSVNNTVTAVTSWDIQAHLKSGIPFKNQFIFTKTPLSLQEQLDWKLPIVEKDSGVWVYDFETLKFIEYFKTVKSCRDKYNIPSSTFKRVRKHRLNCKGYLFSNYEQ
jgi:group I intron endonuclease